MQKWIRARPYELLVTSVPAHWGVHKPCPHAPRRLQVYFLSGKVFPCLWPKRCTLQDQIPGKQWEAKWVLIQRTVSKLLGFQDKAGILPRLGCIIKPMLKLGISVSCFKQERENYIAAETQSHPPAPSPLENHNNTIPRLFLICLTHLACFPWTKVSDISVMDPVEAALWVGR